MLDITEAVNNDALSEDDLYRAFGFTLLAQLGFSPLALFVPGEAGSSGGAPGPWRCKVSLPTRHDFRGATLPAALLTETDQPLPIDPETLPATWHVFRTVLPVRHHERLLAYVLLGNSLHQRRPDAAGHDYSDGTALGFVQTLSSIVLVAAKNRLLARERLAREVLQRELEIAREVQAMLFPKHLPDTAAVAVAATYIPHARVGGDYYDCVELRPDCYLLCVADVSGKGVPASLLMANFQAGLRTMARRGAPLAEIVTELNHLIYSNAQAEKFITAFVAIYDGPARLLHYVNAGHNPPLLLAPDATTPESLEEGTLMFGVLDELPFLTEGERIIAPGTLLLCYTDGLTDVFNDSGADFGEIGVADRLTLARHLPLPALHEALLEGISTFGSAEGVPATFADDITILSARFK